MSCLSCTPVSDERYLIAVTENFKVVLDDKCQLYPGKYIIVSREHLHPNDVHENLALFLEIEKIKVSMEQTIRKLFGHGNIEHRNIKFNYCRLGNSFKDASTEHYHEYGVPISDIPLSCKINSFDHTFVYHLHGKPFDNTVRNYPNSIVLNWILSQILSDYIFIDYKFSDQPLQNTVKPTCFSCSSIQEEIAPLFESKHFKVVLNDRNQWCLGRMLICTKFHIEINKFTFSKILLEEFWTLLRLVKVLIYKFYKDDNGFNTRFHICHLGNVTGQIGDTHSFWHIIPRTSIPIKLNVDGNLISFKDDYWGSPFNNNIKYVPSAPLLNKIRQDLVDLLPHCMYIFDTLCIENIVEIRNSIKVVQRNYVHYPNITACQVGCLQCTAADNDVVYELFRTDNFRVILRPQDQRVPGRSLIISLSHMHPDNFKKRLDLIIEQTILEILIHKVFSICYGYKRCQLLKLGNLTTNPEDEHYHQHYIPSTDNLIKLSVNGEELVIEDERWGKALNINPEEGYQMVKRDMSVIDVIRKDFRDHFIPIDQIRDEITDTLSQIDNLIIDNLIPTVAVITHNLRVTFL